MPLSVSCSVRRHCRTRNKWNNCKLVTIAQLFIFSNVYLVISTKPRDVLGIPKPQLLWPCQVLQVSIVFKNIFEPFYGGKYFFIL